MAKVTWRTFQNLHGASTEYNFSYINIINVRFASAKPIPGRACFLLLCLVASCFPCQKNLHNGLGVRHMFKKRVTTAW